MFNSDLLSYYTEYAKKTAIPFKDTFGENFIQGTVVQFDFNGKSMTLSDGQMLSFTHLVLAMGSSGKFPARTNAITLEELQQEANQTAAEVLAKIL